MNPWMVAHESQQKATKIIEDVIAHPKQHSDNTLRHSWQADLVQLRTAAPFAWSAECVETAWQASAHVPDDTLLSSWNLSVPSAWWHFERPLPVITVAEPAPVRALLMGWIDDRFRLTTWIEDPEHGILPSQIWCWHRGETIGEMRVRVTSEHIALYGPGGPYETAPQIGLESFDDAAVKLSRFVVAGLAWMAQKILVETDGPIERHRRKDYERRYKSKPKSVRVIHLRKIAHQPSTATGGHVAWTCRWQVGGHWRQQVCGPKNGDRRLTYISPYLKGPDDKPLRISERVFEVNR